MPLIPMSNPPTTIDVKNINLPIKKTLKHVFFPIVKTLLNTCIKNIKLQMFPIATFFRYYTRKEYLTQIIKKQKPTICKN